jgi:O-antigen/teichoic acid export membrane protein
MLRLGGNLAIAQCVGYLSRIPDQVLIGRYWGAGSLGLYSKAYSLLVLPFRQLDAPLATVTLPALSRIQDEPERQARYFLRIANLLMWVSLPLVGYLFVCADPVIVVLLGDQWRESATVFRIFAIAAPVLPLFRICALLLQSRGLTERLLRLVLFRAPFIAGSAFIGLPFGITGVALALATALVVTMPLVLSYAFSGTRLTLSRLVRAVLHPFLLWILAVVFTLLVLRLIPTSSEPLHLAVAVLPFATVYVFGAFLPPVRRELLSLRDLLKELRLRRHAR